MSNHSFNERSLERAWKSSSTTRGTRIKTNYVREGNGAIQMCGDKIRKTLLLHKDCRNWFPLRTNTCGQSARASDHPADGEFRARFWLSVALSRERSRTYYILVRERWSTRLQKAGACLLDTGITFIPE